MRYQIVYDKPGRIRFRCGAYAFDKELETAVQKQMLEHPAVKKVEAHAENGGILLHWIPVSWCPLARMRAANESTRISKPI